MSLQSPSPPDPPSADLHPFDRLVALMRILRSEQGCPWDRAQDLRSLKPYAVEECYEVLDAIDSGDPERHRDELGDLLLQVIFQSQIRWEEQAFDAHDVCRAITTKMLRRHPHVFGPSSARVEGADAAHASWESIKAAERAALGEVKDAARSALSGVPRSLPGLLRAGRISEKASLQGFDWQTPEEVLPKVHEELGELTEAMKSGDPGEVEHELGDLLFAVASLARHLGVSPEDALQGANQRFTARFQHMEGAARAQERPLREQAPAELEALWDQAKAALEADA